MPQAVSSVEELRRYIAGVMERAEHHAGNVDEVCLAVAGAIVWRAGDDVEVLVRDGEMKNVLWAKISGERYAISYAHASHQIEVRRKTTQGPVLAAFDNSSALSDIASFFRAL